jgi:hypothetical protein
MVVILILAAVAVIQGAEEATVWDLNHRAQARFWRTVSSHCQTSAHLVDELKWPDLLHGTFAEMTTAMQNQSQMLYNEVIKAESQFSMEGI